MKKLIDFYCVIIALVQSEQIFITTDVLNSSCNIDKILLLNFYNSYFKTRFENTTNLPFNCNSF